jgi:hypothetical protein
MPEKLSERVQITMRITSVVLMLAQIAAGVYLIAIDRSDQVPTLALLVALATGIAGTSAPSALAALLGAKPGSSTKPPSPPKPPPGVGMMLMVLAVALVASSCGSAIGDQARAATIVTGALSAGGDVVMDARGAALDRVEAQYPHDPEHDQQIETEDAHWRPVLTSLDAARDALLAWIDAIDLARIAGGGGDVLGPVITLAGRALALVTSAFAIATSLGVQGLPELPHLAGGQ